MLQHVITVVAWALVVALAFWFVYLDTNKESVREIFVAPPAPLGNGWLVMFYGEQAKRWITAPMVTGYLQVAVALFDDYKSAERYVQSRNEEGAPQRYRIVRVSLLRDYR